MKLLKKGQVGGLQGFILSIVTVAIVLAVGLIIVGEMQTASSEMSTASALNESVGSASNVSSVSQNGALFISASACRNLTGADTAFTLGLHCNVSSTGVVNVNPANGTGVSGSQVGIDYSHYVASEAYNSTGTIISKMATSPTWIGIIIIVSLAFIVLSFFIKKRQ